MAKVIVYSSSLLPYSETFVAEQARALQNWQPVLVGERRLAGGLALDDLQIELLSPDDKMRPLRRSLQLLGLPYPPALRRLRRIGARLVHAHFGTNAVDVWPLVRALRLPMLVSLHGYDINTRADWWRAGHGGPLRRRYPDQLLRLARAPRVEFIAVSQDVRARAIDYGIPAAKVRACPIGIDTRRFQPTGAPLAARPKRILFVGRLVENKGVEYLIRAFAEVRRRHPDAELAIVGEGMLRASLEALAGALALPVRFTGALPPDAVLAELAQARISCLPSVTIANGQSEGFGLVLLEAQACGVPVVTSSRGGMTEGLLEGVTGFALPERDEAALAARLAELLGDAERLERMSRAGPPFVREHFDLRARTRELEREYDRMLE